MTAEAELKDRFSKAFDQYEEFWNEPPPMLVLLMCNMSYIELVEYLELHNRERRRIQIEPGMNGIPAGADI